MFNVDEDGSLLYVPGSDDTGLDVPEGGLFSPPEEVADVLSSSQESGEDGEVAHPQEDGALDEEAHLDGDGQAPLTGSGNSVQIPFSGLSISGEELSITTSGDIYVYPDLPEDEMPVDARSAYAANVQGLPNATSLQYLADVAEGYPDWYEYLCFRTDATYAQSMVLWIGPKGEKNPAQNRIDFSDGVDCVQLNYVRNGTSGSYYYQYNKLHYDSYQIPYNTDVFLYTDIIDGYADFGIMPSYSVVGIAVMAFVVAVIFAILRGGGKS